nr:unnamed protein product [Callosobruchus analis]
MQYNNNEPLDSINWKKKGRGGIENCLFLSMTIYNAFTRGEKVVALFLDISAAYDNVNLTILLEQLNRLK